MKYEPYDIVTLTNAPRRGLTLVPRGIIGEVIRCTESYTTVRWSRDRIPAYYHNLYDIPQTSRMAPWRFTLLERKAGPW